MLDHTTHFGFEEIPTSQKNARVASVFHSVASRYDLMNDLMSLGVHRLWKKMAISHCALLPGEQVLDLAGGTGDLTQHCLKAVGPEGFVVLADINDSMLKAGKARLVDAGFLEQSHIVQASAESLPFPDNTFDCIIISFGLRNVTHQDLALRAMYRTLKPGGRLVILEFSKPTLPLFSTLYDQYSFHVLPKLGEWVCQDPDSYRYLVESIRMHPDQETLKQMMQNAHFEQCEYVNMTGGIVALHRGYKF